MIYKNNGKGGFAVGGNRPTREDLAAGGIAAFALAVMALIGLAKPKKARKTGAVARLLSAPFIFRLAKAGVSRLNLESLAQKARSGDTITTFFTQDVSQKDAAEDEANGSGEAFDNNESELEVIASTPIASEDEVYEHI